MWLRWDMCGVCVVVGCWCVVVLPRIVCFLPILLEIALIDRTIILIIITLHIIVIIVIIIIIRIRVVSFTTLMFLIVRLCSYYYNVVALY